MNITNLMQNCNNKIKKNIYIYIYIKGKQKEMPSEAQCNQIKFEKKNREGMEWKQG